MVNEDKRDPIAGLQPAYEPPRALRMRGMHTGTGGFVPVCEAPGSGAEGDCGTGNSATGWCDENGSSAESCNNQGSGAASCQNPGSGD